MEDVHLDTKTRVKDLDGLLCLVVTLSPLLPGFGHESGLWSSLCDNPCRFSGTGQSRHFFLPCTRLERRRREGRDYEGNEVNHWETGVEGSSRFWGCGREKKEEV